MSRGHGPYGSDLQSYRASDRLESDELADSLTERRQDRGVQGYVCDSRAYPYSGVVIVTS